MKRGILYLLVFSILLGNLSFAQKQNSGDLQHEIVIPSSYFSPKSVGMDSERLDKFMKKLKELQTNGTWNFTGSVINKNDSSGSYQPQALSKTNKFISGVFLLPCIPDSNWQVFPEKVKQQIMPNAGQAENHKHFQEKMGKYKNSPILTRLNVFQSNSLIGIQAWVKEAHRRLDGLGNKSYKLEDNGDGTFGNSNGKSNMLNASQVGVFFVKEVFRVTGERISKGKKTVSPDFLIALTIQETGLGGANAKVLRDRNSWFSVGANDSNIYNAKGYSTIEDSINGVCDLLIRLYDVNSNGTYSSKMHGNTIIGINENYCSNKYEEPYSWSRGIESIIYNAGVRDGQQHKLDALKNIGCGG